MRSIIGSPTQCPCMQHATRCMYTRAALPPHSFIRWGRAIARWKGHAVLFPSRRHLDRLLDAMVVKLQTPAGAGALLCSFKFNASKLLICLPHYFTVNGFCCTLLICTTRTKLPTSGKGAFRSSNG
jgi:hypothetical protein